MGDTSTADSYCSHGVANRDCTALGSGRRSRAVRIFFVSSRSCTTLQEPKGSLVRCCLWISVIGCGVAGCHRVVSPPAPPASRYAVVYNQSFNMSSYAYSEQTHIEGDYIVTTSTTTMSSQNTLNHGSHQMSVEAPSCAGLGWVADCDVFEVDTQ